MKKILVLVLALILALGSFALAEAADENLDAQVYHITEDGQGELSAEELPLLPEDEVTACGHFVYRADYEELSEHELDHVFVCRKDPALIPTDRFRHDEVEAMKWVETGELRAWMLREPEAFSAWFAPAWKLVEQTLFPEEGKETGAQASHDGKELP